MPVDWCWKHEINRAPAAVTEHALKGRGPLHVATQLDESGAIALRQSDSRALLLAADGGDPGVGMQGLAAAIVDDAGDGPDLAVGEPRDFLFDEIDEAALPLEQGQELEGGIE